jgi:hypothetical protein
MSRISLVDITIGIDEPGRGSGIALADSPTQGFRPRAASASSSGLKFFHGTSLDAFRPA